MQTVGIKELKNKLSAYLRAVADGETVRVTDRGRVVAEIVPPRGPADPPGMTDAEREWAELIRQGHVTPAKIPPEERVPPRSLNVMTIEELMAELDADRADR
jgi:prevent-host-death family protein